MIRCVEFGNFKGLSGVGIRFGELTVLSGANSTGKSSVIQALLLLRQLQENSEPIVALNGPYGLALGDGLDVIDHALTGELEIPMALETDNGSATVEFAALEGKSYLDVRSLKGSVWLAGAPLGSFAYIAAERNGPRELYDLPIVSREALRVTPSGDNVAAILAECELDSVPPHLEHPSVPRLRFAKQVEAWLGEVAPGVQLRFETSPDLGKAVLRFKLGGLDADWLRPSNVGFGLSYCLPIIVAGLLTRPESLLIIDSPEAHLHPSAQSALGAFLARVATNGTQVLVETHSDHVLNGIRLAALRAVAAPMRDEIVINHFLREGALEIRDIRILEHGELSQHPARFFDQSEQDLGEIVRLRFGSASAPS